MNSCKECKNKIEKIMCKNCNEQIKNCKGCLKEGLERRYRIYLGILINPLTKENLFIIKGLQTGIKDCDKLDLCWYCFD